MTISDEKNFSLMTLLLAFFCSCLVMFSFSPILTATAAPSQAAPRAHLDQQPPRQTDSDQSNGKGFLLTPPNLGAVGQQPSNARSVKAFARLISREILMCTMRAMSEGQPTDTVHDITDVILHCKTRVPRRFMSAFIIKVDKILEQANYEEPTPL